MFEYLTFDTIIVDELIKMSYFPVQKFTNTKSTSPKIHCIY